MTDLLFCLLFILMTSLIGVICLFCFPGQVYFYVMSGVLFFSGAHENGKNSFEKSAMRQTFMEYQKENDKEKAFATLEKTIELMEQVRKPEGFEKSMMSIAYRDYAIQLEEMGQFDRSEYYYNKSLSLVSQNSASYFQWHEDMGILCSSQNKYQEAALHYAKAQEFYEKTNDLAGKARIYNLISYLNFKQGNREESLEYALKALDNIEAIKTAAMKAAIFDTVACAYQLNEDYPNGEKYIRLAIEQADSDSSFDLKWKKSYYSRLGDLLHAQGKTEDTSH